MRVLALIVFIVLAVAGLILVLQEDAKNGLFTDATPAAVAYTDYANVPTAFETIGTLTYYPNNIGEQIPYLVYRSESGALYTKQLAFWEGSTCYTTMDPPQYPCTLIAEALKAYYGTMFVRVSGTLDASSLIVDTVTPAS